MTRYLLPALALLLALNYALAHPCELPDGSINCEVTYGR
jgi:hypothetical protein